MMIVGGNIVKLFFLGMEKWARRGRASAFTLMSTVDKRVRVLIIVDAVHRI